MSDNFPGIIFIGGTVKREIVPALLEEISNVDAMSEYCSDTEPPATEEELLAIARNPDNNGYLVLMNDEAKYGEFARLENLLVDNGIPFRRHSDARYEFDAEIVEYRPGHGVCCFHAQQSDYSAPLVSSKVILELLAPIKASLAREDGEGEGAFLRLRAEALVKSLELECGADIEALPPFQIEE